MRGAVVGPGGALKGETGGPPSHAFDTVRYAAPRSAAEADFEPVGKRLRALCTTLGIEGALEVEMIYTGGRYDIIEIDPRVSGSTTLSAATITGIEAAVTGALTTV